MGWTRERGVLPVPITVTAEEVSWLLVFTVESQPPDWLGVDVSFYLRVWGGVRVEGGVLTVARELSLRTAMS